jgi:spore germination cell wall hydrolase CwlJ-like protein
MSAALMGSGVGLSLGAIFLAAGMAHHAAEHARGVQMADAAADGYSGALLDANGPGLQAGRERYAFGFDARPAPVRAPVASRQEQAKSKRRTDLQCLTAAVYYEARGEGPRGQAAVAQVVMNRVKHPAFPSTVCGVVFQGASRHHCQFSFACDGSMSQARESAAWDRARRIAARALAGVVMREVGSATHFHAATVAPAWGPQMLRVATVGLHEFYKFAPRRGRAPATPEVQKVVLTAAPAGKVEDLRLTSRMEMAVAASLQPVSSDGAERRPAGEPPVLAAPKPEAEAATTRARPAAAVQPGAPKPPAKPAAGGTEAARVKTAPSAPAASTPQPPVLAATQAG